LRKNGLLFAEIVGSIDNVSEVGVLSGLRRIGNSDLELFRFIGETVNAQFIVKFNTS